VKTEIVAAINHRRRQSATVATERAVARLEHGEPVALPTETVYGLAADALNPTAVAKIFEAKERPHFDPLIVHLPNRDWLNRVVAVRDDEQQLIGKLADRFWPGPFTIVLPKREIIPAIVTAGLDTIAVRISSHPVFAQIIGGFGKPLAAPSANRFGRVSPTTAQHVRDELDGRIPLIVDGGPTAHGIESTIVTVRDRKIQILRRGPVTTEELSKFGKIDIAAPIGKVSVPGQLPTHYAPRTPLCLIESAGAFLPEENQRVGLLAWNSAGSAKTFAVVRCLSDRQDFREAAANLFCYLRELDQSDLDLIVAERVPLHGLGAAIMDRLQRAAHGPLDAQDRPE
jgi:L-threonylcarbamoyladenylate synthase